MHDSYSPWRGRRVLVTGGTGFLGGAVVAELLAAGAEVVGLVRNRAAAALLARHQLAGRVHIVHGRTEDLFRIHSALAVHEVEAVFHLAATEPLNTDPGTAAVFDAIRRFDSRVPTIVARRGTAPPIGHSPWLLGIARFGELFGRGDRRIDRFTGNAAFMDRGSRDFVRGRDAARACLLLAESLMDRPEPTVSEAAFQSGWLLTAREMVAALREAAAGIPPAIAVAAWPDNPFGWAPALNFSEAMADTVAWCREFADAPDRSGPPANPTRRAA